MLLRSDNADRRLSPIAVELGLLDSRHGTAVAHKEERIRAAVALLHSHRHPDDQAPLATWLRRPGTLLEPMLRDDVVRATCPALIAMALTPSERSEVEAEVVYDGYIKRQAMEEERMRRLEHQTIPKGFDYGALTGLSNEARQQLVARQPLTLGEASRLSGVRPADVHLVLTMVRRSAGDRPAAAFTTPHN